MNVDLKELSENEWSQIAHELRLLVLSSGFIDWDRDLMRSLEEERDEGRKLSSRHFVTLYAKRFAAFLTIRTEPKLRSVEERLQTLRSKESEVRIGAVLLSEDEESVSLIHKPVSPEFINELKTFALAAEEQLSYELRNSDDPESESSPGPGGI
ncbi:hypothetical protein [Devosia beringensis]|uniref:hypothetical protein n=1 Tax=Devosia beringensis TaxID=2657486 RepID=UPI00186BB120|nr:hypothetical protein [Devosia beringensis]